MKVLVLEGSPHRHGTTHRMAEFFVRGARERGHDVEVLDVARANLHPCQACDACFRLGKCIQKDDGNTILE